MYVLRRFKDKQYVAKPGSINSYTKRFDKAQRFKDLTEAEKNRCVESEYIEPIN